MDRATVTNAQVGKDLGITHSAVSRIRSGKRHPSVTLMRKIELTYGWRAESQLRVFGSTQYAEGFEQALTRYYSRQVAAS